MRCGLTSPPVSPWETHGVCEARCGCVYQRRVPFCLRPAAAKPSLTLVTVLVTIGVTIPFFLTHSPSHIRTLKPQNHLCLCWESIIYHFLSRLVVIASGGTSDPRVGGSSPSGRTNDEKW